MAVAATVLMVVLLLVMVTVSATRFPTSVWMLMAVGTAEVIMLSLPCLAFLHGVVQNWNVVMAMAEKLFNEAANEASGAEEETEGSGEENGSKTSPRSNTSSEGSTASYQEVPVWKKFVIASCGLIIVMTILECLSLCLTVLLDIHLLLWRGLAQGPHSSNASFPETCPLGLPTLVTDRWSPMTGWPRDCWEPACGIGRSRFGTVWIHEQGSLNVTDVLRLPHGCNRIMDTDLAEPDTMKECTSFCNSLLGEAFASLPLSPYCSLAFDTNSTAHLLKVCTKTATARIAWVVRPPWAPIALGFVYLAISLILLWLEHLVEGEPGYELVDGDGRQHLEVPMAGEPACEESSREEVSSFEGSNLTRASFEIVPPADNQSRLGRLDMPLRVLPCRTDVERAIWQLSMSTVSLVLDPVTDIMTIASFAAHGQPWWMLLTALTVASSGDAWQLGCLRAICESWQQGFPTKDLLKRQAHEGLIEGTISGAIVLFSLLSTSPSALGLTTVATRLFSFSVSFVLAIPGALQAQAVLNEERFGDINLNNYYDQEAAKASVSNVQKYGLPVAAAVLTAAATLRKELPGAVGVCFWRMLLLAVCSRLSIYETLVHRGFPAFARAFWLVMFAFDPLFMLLLGFARATNAWLGHPVSWIV